MARINRGKGLQASLRAKARREFLVRALGEIEASVLEVGALDNPTFLPEEGEVAFADFFTQDESRARHRDAKFHNAERIVPVDYVLRDTTLGAAVDRRFDLLIANHVLEHLPDPIRWLQDAAGIADRVFLSVPDRRYTFDYFKPENDAADWIEAYREQRVKPNFTQVLRHLYYHAGLRGDMAWKGEIPADHLHRFTMTEAMRRAEDSEAGYMDVHCWVFTVDSFKTLLRDLEDTGLLDWRVQRLEAPLTGENEFRVLLERAEL